MLSREDNDLLCKVDPGTPMGDLMRQYWIPFMASTELPGSDCPPVRVRLLGEDLVAWRNTGGSVGLMQNACPHRGASMFFGRNEENGLRCVYHGWKFDSTGDCVDMPNEPAESNFKHKIKAAAYPCLEVSGIVMAYMGNRATPPPVPAFETNALDPDERTVNMYQRECNYMQALEGDIDTSHVGFLHLGAAKAEEAAPGTFAEYALKHRDPRYEVLATEYGTMYGTYRPAGDNNWYWRVAHFLMPFYTMPPVGVLGARMGNLHAWVPMDNEHTLSITVSAKPTSDKSPLKHAQPNRHPQVTSPGAYFGNGTLLPAAPGPLGRFRVQQNAGNDYGMDRAKQKTESYTGIDGIALQDQAITESMGAVYNRTQERLGTSDMMIIRTRRRLIEAAKALRATGETPPAADNPELYAQRPGGVILPRKVNWLDATAGLRAPHVMHPEIDLSVSGNIVGAG
jgi:phenylpropionate dioxygenase-like ring-hydroxylating dioxygenase large terminal subunit